MNGIDNPGSRLASGLDTAPDGAAPDARTSTEMTLAEQTAELSGIVEHSINEIYVFDAATLQFVYLNAAARSNLGYSPDELGRMTPADIKPRYTLDQLKEKLAALVTGTQDRVVFDTPHQRKDGSEYPAEVHVQYMTHQGRPVFVAIVLDVTDRVRAEAALRESNEQLEQRIEARTRDLDAAMHEAERANATKSRFLAAASHDLRQPLQSAGIYLAVLAQELPDVPQARDILDKARQSLTLMGELVDALLDISRLDSGQIEPERRNFRVTDLLERIVADNLPQAQAKGLRLESPDCDCIVYSDPTLLERVIENFVTNAIRYTRVGTVSLGCKRTDEHVSIFVSDTGVGIPPEALEDIFEEYYQLGNPMRDKREGLGLGLAIVRHIAKLLDHPIDVSSIVGRGTTFSIEVPLGTTVAETRTETFAFPAGSAGIQRRPVVLVVDDDAAIVDSTSLLLKSIGVTVHTAMNGEECLAHIAAGVQPDLVVSDYRLPGYNGIELIRRLRAMPAASATPAVLLTGDTSASEIQRAGLPDCTVLRKPVDTGKLMRIIENIDTGATAPPAT